MEWYRPEFMREFERPHDEVAEPERFSFHGMICDRMQDFRM